VRPYVVTILRKFSWVYVAKVVMYLMIRPNLQGKINTKYKVYLTVIFKVVEVYIL
jgi:hypothetical protein